MLETLTNPIFIFFRNMYCFSVSIFLHILVSVYLKYCYTQSRDLKFENNTTMELEILQRAHHVLIAELDPEGVLNGLRRYRS